MFDFFEDFKINKVLVGIILIIVIIICTILNGFYTVGEQETAILTMFNKVISTHDAGLYFKIPWLQSVNIIDKTTHSMTIGYENIRGKDVSTDDGIMITKDFNFVNIDFFLEYKISNPIYYIYNTKEPIVILKNFALAAIRSTVLMYNVDDVITTAKSQIQIQVKEKLNKMLEDNHIGLQIVNLTIQDAVPPTEKIINAFKAVETAKQGKETTINYAKKYNSEQMPSASAQVDQIIQKAEAIKAARIAEAEGQVARFNSMFEQYKSYPLITKQRIYYETLETILPNIKLYITDGNTTKLLPLERFGN